MFRQRSGFTGLFFDCRSVVRCFLSSFGIALRSRRGLVPPSQVGGACFGIACVIGTIADSFMALTVEEGPMVPKQHARHHVGLGFAV